MTVKDNAMVKNWKRNSEEQMKSVRMLSGWKINLQMYSAKMIRLQQ